MILNEEEKNRILSLHNFYKKNYVGTSLTPLNEANIVHGKKNDPWEYKEVGNSYFVKKKGDLSNRWIKVSGNAEIEVAKLFGKKIQSDLYSFFKNETQSDMFRAWIIKNFPNTTKKYNLEPTGPYNDETIKKVANTRVTTKNFDNKKLGYIFFKLNKKATYTSDEPGKTLPSLVKTGFKINENRWEENLGYYVDKCTQTGCAEYTYDMIGQKFGDAWQAYKDFDVYASVDSSLVSKMEALFNSINKKGSPGLNQVTDDDETAKSIIIDLIPNQSKFSSLGLGTVVGLYYPDSSNFDLAFFQSAIGKFRDQNGTYYPLRAPYFCKDPNNCYGTRWKIEDDKTTTQFKAGPTLKSGKSFIPNTHLGFIGYIDEKGEPYVVHSVHKTVYAYPVSKMIPGQTLSIIWAGNPDDVK
jgi:hypothetical protein